MDNFTHSLVGWALGQAGLKTKSRKGLAALVLGANMPDIDVFFGWVSWAPLATHRGFTHGIVAAIIMPPILAGLLWLIDRWQARRGEEFASGLSMNVPWLIALSYIGALSHPLLDLQTTYSVQLLSPFSTLWFHTETLFIIDAWIWTGLAFAIWLSRRREKRGETWGRPVGIALIALCGYVGLNGAISLTARHMTRAEAPDILFANEQPILFWKRDLVWRRDGMIGRARYDPLRNPTGLSDIQPMMPDNMSDPLVRRAMTASREMVTFMRWSTMPVAMVERGRCEALVRVSDARFGEPRPGDRFLREVRLPIVGAGCPATKAVG